MFRSNLLLIALFCASAPLLLPCSAMSEERGDTSRDLDDFSTHLFVPDFANNRVLIYTDAQYNGQKANVVLGQPSFSTGAPGLSAATLNGPNATAQDLSRNLYISDSLNCRVVQYHAPATTGESASLVFGAPDFLTGCTSAPPTASTMGHTGGVAVDFKGNLWVSDTTNNRVLHFSRPFSNGMAADLVLGQPDLVSNSCAAAGQNTLCYPEGLSIDLDGNLWVADSSDNRVLEFQPPFSTYMNASVELGQPDFVSNGSNNPSISASTLFLPSGVSMDLVHSRLWVADKANSRVLLYNKPFLSGMAASLVLGQPDFVSSQANQGGSTPTSATLANPQGVFAALSGNLWVGDTGNNRTLKFTPTYQNGQSAKKVLGQANFTSNAANQGSPTPTRTSQSAPYSAGPSIIALGLLAGLAGTREWLKRRGLA